MKKHLFVFFSTVILCACGSKKEVVKSSVTKTETVITSSPAVTENSITYTKHIKPIVEQNCTYKCHTDKKRNQKGVNLDTYKNVRKTFEIGKGYKRIHNDKRPMPKKGKMPDATLAILDQWKNDGFLE